MADPRILNVRNVLVVAPHPDDESLGCGGLIAKLAGQRQRFHTVFVTDGGASHPRSLKWPRQRLAECREREAGRALQLLGIGDQPRTFLRLQDADMPAAASVEWRAAVTQLATILQALHPNLVLLPWRRDPHRDHRASWQLAMDALSRSAAQPRILEYAIWLEEYGVAGDFPAPNEVEAIVIDVSRELKKKRSAIAAHVSQTSNLIDDDPTAFRLAPTTITRLTGRFERYWQIPDKPIDPEGFEKKYQQNIDPWDYTTSAFERYKRSVLLRACGCHTYGRGLELACSTGVTTECLAHRCLRLLAVDSSATALREARRRLRSVENVIIRQVVLPAETPRGPFDLIVASEIVYYLNRRELAVLLKKLDSALAPGGRIVILNHARLFPDASQPPALAQCTVGLTLGKTMRIVFHERHSRFDVIALRKPRV